MSGFPDVGFHTTAIPTRAIPSESTSTVQAFGAPSSRSLTAQEWGTAKHDRPPTEQAKLPPA